MNFPLKRKWISILGLLFFCTAKASDPGGDFVCDGIIPPSLDVNVTGVEICPGDQGSVEVDDTTSEGTMYGHYEGTDEQESFGLSFTDTQLTEPQVFEAPARYTAFWIKHDTINMSGQYEDCGGGTVTVKDYDMGTVTLKDCKTKKTKKPKGSTGGSGGGGGGGGGGPKDEEKKEGECEEPAQPDEGVAEFFGGEEAWIVCPAPKEEEDKESMWFVATHRIVTINTPKARDLKGTIKLNKVSGDEGCAKWLVVNDNVESSYSFGEAIPIVEPGHEGCGVHDWHGGEQFFGLIPEKPGEVVLEAEVDPEEGSSTKKAQLKIAIVETDLDIVHPATGEVSEENEETDGLVAVKRDNDTPLTRLKLRQVNPLSVGGKYHLTFSSNLKIWKSANRSGEVTSETEFEANGETILFVEAINKSGALNDQEVALHWKDGEKEITDGDIVNLTAVEAEIEAQVRYWIREQWLDLPLVHPQNIGGLKIAEGDDREESLNLSQTSRITHAIVLNPFKELDEDGVKTGSAEIKPGVSKLYVKAISVPHPDQGYSANNRLLNGVQPWHAKAVVVNDIQADGKRINDRMASVRFHGTANDEAVWFSADIDWDFEFKVDATDPLKIKYNLEGWHDDYPAVEVHVEDSLGPRVFSYFYLHPLPSNVFDLINGKQIDISNNEGVIP